MNADPIDVRAVRRHFLFPGAGRVVTNNAASTQPPVELLDLFRRLAPDYENVHRGQSGASRRTTARFESAYDDIARFVGAPGRANIVVTRNTTEAHNAVMYSLLTEFRDGDNVVTTMMEHNSNYVPWHGLCREILPRLGRRVQLRIARFDPRTGELDLDHLASLVDRRTKIVCCTGASNFLGTKNPLDAVAALAAASGYPQPSFSFHKMLAPFGVGVLVAKEHLLAGSAPFLYGGDMIAEGQVYPDRVDYNALPWKFAAGTPDILGTIVSAQALRLLVDLALNPARTRWFGSPAALDPQAVATAMGRVAHHALGLTPPASCRLSFYLYNTVDDVERACAAVRAAVTGVPAPRRGRPGGSAVPVPLPDAPTVADPAPRAADPVAPTIGRAV